MTWMTPCSDCRRPVTFSKRAPSTMARKRSKIFGQTMMLATPVSSSSVAKITPDAVPGRWRTRTSPATETRRPLCMSGRRSASTMPRAASSLPQERDGMRLQRKRERAIVAHHMLAERHQRQRHLRLRSADRSPSPAAAKIGSRSAAESGSSARTSQSAARRSRPIERKHRPRRAAPDRRAKCRSEARDRARL